MRFGFPQQFKFSALKGTYSQVTQTEFKDSQITATDDEAELLINYFGVENIFRGNVGDSAGQSSKEFTLYPSGKKITLNLIFPKPLKQELRLYISKSAGFKPEAGSVWFLFLKDSALWIGSMTEPEWRNENRILTFDEEDGSYQQDIFNGRIRTAVQPQREVYLRDIAIAQEAFKRSNYKCEFDPSHVTFTARSSELPYIEAHHLMPISLQGNYSKPLDNIHNIFCLCPNCHRQIHYSIQSETKIIIDRLIEQRPEILDVFNLSHADFYKIYSVEDIGKY
jgi:5-methylcytosine-specific restriction protein A